MFFNFKKSPVQIDCFVPEAYSFAAEFAPVQKASKFLPQWFRNLPVINKQSFYERDINDNVGNVRGCPGIISSLSRGFIVPMWSDLRIDWVNDDLKYKFSDKISKIDYHPNEQATGFADNHWILRLMSPWILKFSRPSTITSLPLTYYHGMDSPIRTIHGLMETRSRHNYIPSTQFLLLQKSTELKKYIIDFNTPIYHFVPMGEYEYKIKCHVDTKEYNKIFLTFSSPLSFFKKGIKQLAIDKKKEEEKSCPFH